MKTIIFILSLLVINNSLANKIKETDSLNLILATGENKWWSLLDLFPDRMDNVQYEVSENSYFAIVPPLTAVDTSKNFKQSANIIEVVAQRQSLNGAWLNNYAFLDSSPQGYNIFWAFGSQIDGFLSPWFSTVTPLIGTQQLCLGLDFVSNSQLVVDCFDPITNKNYFYLVTAQKTIQLDGTNNVGYSEISARFIQVNQVQSLTEKVRATPTYGAPIAFQGNSVVEVFTIFDDQVSLISILDVATLAGILGDKSGFFTFDLVKLIVLENGQIYILDQSGFIYSLTHSADGLWQLQGILDLKGAKPFGMDINIQIQDDGTQVTYVTVLFYDYFVLYNWPDGQGNHAYQVRIYDTNMIVDQYPGPTIKLSQDLIILENSQNNYITVYEIQTNKIITQSPSFEGQVSWLVNPQQNRIISLTETQSNSWALSRGQLQFISRFLPAKNMDITITATSGTTIQQVNINFSVYDRSSFELVPLPDQSNPIELPEFLAETYQTTIRNNLVSGPNQQYAGKVIQGNDESSQLILFESLILQQLDLSFTAGDISYPQHEDVVNVDVLTNNDPRIVFQVIQTLDNKITLWKCNMEQQYNSPTHCESKGQIQLTTSYSTKPFQSQTYLYQVLISALVTPYQLTLYVCEVRCDEAYSITYPDEQGHEITSFIYLDKHLLVVRANQKSIDVYSTFYPFELITTIDQSVVQELGYDGVWAPTRVFGNRYINPNTLFIDNQENLIIANFHNQLTLLKNIPYILQNSYVDVAVYEQTFFIAETDGTKSYLHEYNYNDPVNIKLQKEVYLYWYTFQTPLQTSFSPLNGYFFIRGYCTKCDKTFILAFKPDTSQRDALYQAIYTGTLVPNDVSLTFSAFGYNEMFIYLNTGKLQSTWSLLNYPYARLSPGNSDELVVQDVPLTMIISNFNFDGANTLIYDQKLTIFNTQLNIQFNNDEFNKETVSAFKVYKNSQPNYLKLQQDWYSGQVISFSASCKDCGDDAGVILENVVNPRDLAFSLEAVTDFSYQQGDDLVLAQTATTMWYIQNDQQAYPFLEFDLPDQVQCTLLSSVKSWLYVLSICEDTQAYYLHISSCIGLHQCFDAGLIPFPQNGPQQISKFAVLENTDIINIIVLNNDATNPTKYSGSIITYKLVTNGQIWQLSLNQEIDTNSLMSIIYPSDMTYFSYMGKDGQTYYKIVFTDAINGISALDGSVQNGLLTFSTTTFEFLNLNSFLRNRGQYVSSQTKFQQVKQYDVSTQTNILTTKFILTTSDVAHFGLTINFDISVAGKAIAKTILVDFTLNRYGAQLALNKLRIQDNLIIIPYLSNKDIGQVTLCQYEIPNSNNLAGTPNILISGGAQIFTDEKQIRYLPLAIQMNSMTNQYNLLTSQAQSFTINNSTNYPRLIITNPSIIPTQNITIIAYNSFVSKLPSATSLLRINYLQCSNLIPSIGLILATEENKWWGLTESLFDGFNLTYSVSNNDYFKILPPLTAVGRSQDYKQPANIVQSVPQKVFSNGVWLNNFAFLDQSKTGYNVFWAFRYIQILYFTIKNNVSSSLNGLQSPKFSTVTPVVQNQACFGLDYLSSSKLVVDCFDPVSKTNYFQIVTAQGTTQINAYNRYQQSSISNRQIQVTFVQSLLEVITYIYRATPSYGQSRFLSGKSFIEVFTIDNNNNLSLFSTLDQVTLSLLLGDLSGSVKFDLIEFQVTSDGFIYVLDQNSMIYRLKLRSDGYWQLEGTIDLNGKQPFAMDVNNYGDSTILAILYNNTAEIYTWPSYQNFPILNRVQQTQIIINAYPSPAFQISQETLLIQNPVDNSLVLYELNSDNVLYETGPLAQIDFLINPLEKQLITLSSVNSQAWIFSQGYLQYGSSKVPTNQQGQIVNLIATSVDTVNALGDSYSCQIPIQFSVYDRSNYELVRIDDQSDPLVFPEFIAQNVSVPINGNLISGPNQQYQGIQSNYLDVQSLVLTQLNIVSQKQFIYPDAKNIIFAQTLTVEDPQVVFEVLQTTDFLLSIWKCNVQQQYNPNTQTNCFEVGQIQSSLQLSSSTLQSWINFDQIIVGTLIDSFTIGLYSCETDTGCRLGSQVSYPNFNGNQITCFTFLDKFLWVLRSEQKQIEIYSQLNGFQFVQSIDQTLIFNQGYTDTWGPRALFSNKQLKGNTVFIDNKISLIVVDYDNALQFLIQIPYIIVNPQIQVGIAKTTFLLAETDGVKQYLHEYDYTERYNIKFQKDHYLYWFSLDLPLQASVSAQNGYFFIRALCTKSSTTKILVFKPNMSQREALYQVINTGLLVPTGTSMILSTSGSDNMFIYLNLLGQQSSWQFSSQPYIQLVPKDNDEMVAQDIPVRVVISNFNDGNNIEFGSQLTVFNTKSNINFNSDNFNKEARIKFKLISSKKTQVVQLPSNWYQGQILNFTAVCSNCGDQVVLENVMNPQDLPFSLSSVTDFSESIQQRGLIFAQSSSILWYLDDKGQARPFLNFDLPDQVQCKLLSNVNSGLYVLSICEDQVQYYLHITSCVSQQNCFDAGLIPFPSNGPQQISKFVVIETLDTINIIVLNNDQLSPDSYGGSIITYTLTANENVWALIKNQEINNLSLNIDTPLYPADMTYFEYGCTDGNSYYKLMFTDINEGLFVLDASLIDNLLYVKVSSLAQLNLRQYLKSQNQFIASTTQFLSISNYDISILSTVLSANLIVTTNNVAHFGLTLNFDISTCGKAPLKSQGIEFVLNRYGASVALNKIQVKNNFIIIPYLSSQTSNLVTLCQYEMQYNLFNIKSSIFSSQFVQGQSITFTGGVEIKLDSEKLQYLPIAIIDFEQTGKTTLFTSQSQSYDLNSHQYYPRIVVSNPNDIKNQIITLVAYNEQIAYQAQASSVITLGALQNCSNNNNIQSLNLILSTEENKYWGLQDVFFTGYNLSYALSDSSNFQIIPALQTVDSLRNKYNDANIVQVVGNTLANRKWSYDFAFLDNSNGYNVYQAFGQVGFSSPKFESIVPVTKNDQLKCFGLEYLTKTSLILDCRNQQTYVDELYFIMDQKLNGGAVTLPKTGNYQLNNRFIKVQQLSTHTDGQYYVYQATPSYNDPSLAGNSFINVYLITNNANIYSVALITTLDSDALAVLIGHDITFDLIQLDISQEDGSLYILDMSGIVYNIAYNQQKWVLMGSFFVFDQGQPYGFDVSIQVDNDGNTHRYIAVQFSYTIELYDWQDLKQQPTNICEYDLDFTISQYPAPLLKISSNNIIINNPLNNGLIIYTLGQNNILTQTGAMDQSLTYLINPANSQIVSLSKDTAIGWVYQQAQLQFKSTELPTKLNVDVIASSIYTVGSGDESQVCRVPITYQVLDRASTDIIEISTEANPLVVPEFISQNYMAPLKNLVSGPNLQYQASYSSVKSNSFLSADNVQPITVQSITLSQLNVKNKSIYPDSKNVNFADTQSISSDQTVFYQILQTNNANVQIFYCKVAQQQQTSCSSSHVIELQNESKNKGFQSQAYDDQIVLGVQVKPNVIDVYNCDDGVCANKNSIQLDGITSFAFLNQQLWVVQADLMQITVFSDKFEVVMVINQQLAKELGYYNAILGWNPRQVFGTSNSGTILIDTKGILVVAVENNKIIQFIGQVQYQLQNAQVQVGLGQDTFFVVESDGTNSLVYEHSFDFNQGVRFIKNIYLYWYQLQLPLQTSISNTNGYFFIKVLDTKTKLTSILVIKPNTSQRDNLYQVIDTGILVNDNTQLIFATSNGDDVYIYLNIGTQQSQWKLLGQPQLNLIPENMSESVQTISLNIIAYNFNSANKINFPQSIILFNSNSKIELNQDAFKDQASKAFKLKNNNNDETIVQIAQNWYNGQVLYYEAECKNCSQNGPIKVENVVQSQSLPQSLGVVNDYLQLTSKLLALSSNNVWFVNETSGSVQSLIEIDQSVKCTLLQSGDDGISIFAYCLNTTSSYINYMINLNNKYVSMGLYRLGLTSISKFVVIETTLGVNFIFQNTDLSDRSAFAGSILTFTFLNINGQWSLNGNQVLMNSAVYPSDMTYFKFGRQQYKFYILALQDVYMFDATISSDGKLIFQLSYELINLKKELSKLGQYFGNSSTFQQINNYKNVDDSTQQLWNSKIIITTNNVLQYGLTISFNSAQSTKLIYKSFNLDFTLNRYGGSLALNKLIVSGQNIIIPYQSQINTKSVTLALYTIPNQNTLLYGVQNLIQISGGVEVMMNEQQQQYLPLVVSNSSILYTNQAYKYLLNSAGKYPRVVIQNQSSVESQDITIIAYNEQFGQAPATTTISFENISKSSSKLAWWAILLIVLACIVTVGGGYLLWQKYQNKKSKKTEALLGNVQQAASEIDSMKSKSEVNNSLLR